MIFVGHFCSSSDFAAVSIASALANVTGHSVMVGLSSGLATLASQAYGAGDFRAMNRVFFKALTLLLSVCVPLSILWQWTRAFFVVSGQDATVSAEAGRYMRALVPRYVLTQTLFYDMLVQGIYLYLCDISREQDAGYTLPSVERECTSFILVGTHITRLLILTDSIPLTLPTVYGCTPFCSV